MKGRLPRTLSRALGVGWVCSAPPGWGGSSGLPLCPVLHTKPSPITQCLPMLGLSQLCIPQDVQELCRSPRLTCGRRWPLSARTGCAGCSERTGTAGWRHRWCRLAAVPQTHLHGRDGAQSIPRAPPSFPRALGRAGTHSCTWHVGGMLQVVVGAAILGALHEVGGLIHVLGRKERMGWPHCCTRAQQRSRAGGRASSLKGPLTSHMPSKGTCSWKSFTMSYHHS